MGEQLQLRWDTDVTRMADGSFLVRPIKPVQASGEGKALTVEAAARRLEMSERLVRRLCQEGELFAYRQRLKCWRIPPAAVKVYRQWQAGAISEPEREDAMEALRVAAKKG